ncbi:MAG TPA: glycosyltransferase family 4 protein [Terriglobales bacterium]|nr:glycosyltransferase family 4 protein [Terriglobales bacterium]
MKVIAYLANSFPEPGECYVYEEISELRKRASRVISCSFRKPRKLVPDLEVLVLRAIRGPERVGRRLRTLAHTFLGACLAVELRTEKVEHLHVHHGYFSAWAGMVAARLLNVTYSITLHGSDLLVRADYIDCKLKNSAFCITISEFNRNHILQRYREIHPAKVLVHRLGVDPGFWRPQAKPDSNSFLILSVGRLHAVKNQEFLIRACGELKKKGIQFTCVIAGEGEERERLKRLVFGLRLEREVELIGNVTREDLRFWYGQADVVVFTSHSEGIPLAAMEAMAMERIVLAPRITGIPELIVHGRNGFLYEPNSKGDFLEKLLQIRNSRELLHDLRCQARMQIELKFNRERNLVSFASDFLRHIEANTVAKNGANANSLLQQVQLPV